MPWQSLNASRTRRSETPAAALRSLSVTLWYCTLAAYCTHAHTMRTLAGRARGGAPDRANRIPMPDSSRPLLTDPRCGRCSVASTIWSCGSMRRDGLDAVVLLACDLCSSPLRPPPRRTDHSERMICL